MDRSPVRGRVPQVTKNPVGGKGRLAGRLSGCAANCDIRQIPHSQQRVLPAGPMVVTYDSWRYAE